MATVDEALLSGRSPLASDLAEGVNAISSEQVVRFTKYVRLVLPLDGFVFWVRADLLSPSALANAFVANPFYLDGAGAPVGVPLNSAPRLITPAAFVDAKGSLHYATDTRQEEASTYAQNRVVFTSLDEVQDLNEIGPNVLFIGTIDGVRFAFSTRGSFYRQAKLYHYVGNAVYSELDTQLVDKLDGFNSRDVVVSNSLPLWLALNGYVPFYGFACPITLYPSFLVPNNLAPPYGSVHIAPESTRSLAGAPFLTSSSTHSQLCAETVKVTMFGARNFTALDFLDCVMQRSRDYEDFGIMNMPAVRDEKRTQAELNAIAQKKSVVFEISYYQQRVNDVARQMILSAIPTYHVDGEPLAA